MLQYLYDKMKYFWNEAHARSFQRHTTKTENLRMRREKFKITKNLEKSFHHKLPFQNYD